MMPEHYAIEANCYRGSIAFDDTKTAIVYFKNKQGQQVSFTKRPFVTLTVADQTTNPAIRQSWKKTGNLFVGIKIKFAAKYTGDVEWEVRK